MRISIIIPVYNAAKTLEDTVRSILSANFDDSCELILVDDGSTDESPALCDRLGCLHPAIKVIHKPNGGVSDARNTGVDNATGDYLMFVDSDDLLPAMALHFCRNVLDSGVDMVVGGYSVRTLSGRTISKVQAPLSTRVYSKWELPMFWDDCWQPGGSFLRPVWGKLFRRELICSGSVLRFQKALNYGEDMLFLFEYLCRCRSVATVSESIYIYREGNAGLSADLSSDSHLYQLLQLCGLYSKLIDQLQESFPGSKAVSALRHSDLVGRLVCRALTVFSTRRTVACTRDNISRLYSIMGKDAELKGIKGLFSLRNGQIPNLMLFKMGSPLLSEKVYRLSAAFCECMNLKPKRY